MTRGNYVVPFTGTIMVILLHILSEISIPSGLVKHKIYLWRIMTYFDGITWNLAVKVLNSTVYIQHIK